MTEQIEHSVPLRKGFSFPWPRISSMADRHKELFGQLTSLRHQNIEAVHEVHFNPPKDCYLLCERIEGDSLADILDRERRLPLEVVRSITRQAASALTAAHDLGLTHGNLSPSAIMIQRPASADAEVWVKVRDFGLGKPLGPELFGALGYLAPEQVDPKEPRPDPTPLSDQFALAVIAFEMLAGRRAFIGDSVEEIAPKLREDPVHFQIQGVSKKESQRIISGLHKAMARLPSARFATLGEFVAALEARAQNPRSRNSVIEASRLASEHQPPLQLGSSVAKALVAASSKLPGPLDQLRPGQDAQTLTLVRSVSTHTSQTATVPMLPRLELQVNVQTTIANKNDSHVNVVMPPPAAAWPAAHLRLKWRRIGLGLLLGVMISAGLAWAFVRLGTDESRAASRANKSDPAEPVAPHPDSDRPRGAIPFADKLPDPNQSPQPHHNGARQDPKPKLQPHHKLTLSCMPMNKLASVLSQHVGECNSAQKETWRGSSVVLPVTVDGNRLVLTTNDPPPQGPAPLLRCLRDFMLKSRRPELSALPKVGGVLRCTIK